MTFAGTTDTRLGSFDSPYTQRGRMAHWWQARRTIPCIWDSSNCIL